MTSDLPAKVRVTIQSDGCQIRRFHVNARVGCCTAAEGVGDVNRAVGKREGKGGREGEKEGAR